MKLGGSRLRQRHNRLLHVRLECGCVAKLETGRYRVSKDFEAILYGTAVRKGVWCKKCVGRRQPVACLGVFREDGEKSGKTVRTGPCSKCRGSRENQADAYCRRCKNEYSRKWNKSARGQATAKSRYLGMYGLTLDEYRSLLDAQGGACRICGRVPKPTGKSLAVDHDHDTGQVRGLICVICNRAIGQLGDCPAMLRRAADYLEGKLALLHGKAPHAKRSCDATDERKPNSA